MLGILLGAILYAARVPAVALALLGSDFNKDERYLVSFVTRPRVTPVLIYRVDDSGELRPMRWNPGGEQKIHTNLFGRRVSDVLEALKGK